MCRTKFSLLLPHGQKEIAFFVELPARVVKEDAVILWPLLPVEMAADPAHDWLQQEGAFLVMAACWSRDEWGIYLGVLLGRGRPLNGYAPASETASETGPQTAPEQDGQAVGA